jgi:acyl-CoA synthetase (AMP-forming)/AMP-acid ligase II
MIIRGGSNVSPLEVEDVLGAHPDVADVVVVGVPDPEYGEQVAAAIVLAPDGRLDEAALREFCADKLAAYKIPTLFRRFDELPRNANGKVLRREVAPVLRGDAVPAS